MSEFVCVNDFAKYVDDNLPRNALDYYNTGAGQEQTLAENEKAYSRYKIRPRCLRDVSHHDLSTTVLGEKVSMPIGISPTGLQRMAHLEGECATVRAAQALGTIFTLSCFATSNIETVAKASPEALKWMQVVIFKDRAFTKELVQRAEKAGYKALVFTVDFPIFGIRLSDIRNKFVLPSHLSLANFEDRVPSNTNNGSEKGSKVTEYVRTQIDPSITWQDLKWLRSITKLPLVAKSIQTAEDALLCVESGVDAIAVSNHGGRQLDGAAATIDILSEIVEAVGDKVEVYVDGGIRTGSDIFKALALGAKMVFVGRPVIWGLAHSGEQGVKRVLNILKDEFENTLLLSGCSTLLDIRRSMVVHESYYSKL